MKILPIVFLFSSLVVNNVQAQSSKTEDVIYLKNKWILRGKIVPQDSAAIAIQTHDGNVYVFTTVDIDKIVKEKTWRGFIYKAKGFANFTELGPLIAGKTTIDGVTTAAFSFQEVSGYRFSQYVMLGIGLGADLYATQTVLPVFASFRGDILTAGTVIPFYFADAGHGINITQNSLNGTNFKGGIMYALGLGIKIPFNRSAGFLLSAGYRYQKTTYALNDTSTDVFYKRLALRAGFFL